MTILKLKCLKKEKEVYHKQQFLSSFGGTCGFRLYSDCNKNCQSWSDLGYEDRYELPEDIFYGTDEARSYLAGSFYFQVQEIEVYLLR